MEKRVYYGGYDITIRQNKANGLYELSAMVESMGEEYRERMLATEMDATTLSNFVNKIEHNK